MNLSRTNLVLLSLLAVAVAIAALVHVDYTRPNFEIALGDDMTYSPAYGAFAPNANFRDGRTQQAPVPGTIARGSWPVHYAATPEDAVRAGEELQSPYFADGDQRRAAAERGADVYRVFCTACHGAGGAGDGPVAQRGFPPPPSMRTGKSVQMKDGQLFHILTYGQANMPSFAAQISPPRRWDVIAYVRDLQQRSAQEAQTPEEAAGTAPSAAETESTSKRQTGG